MNIKTIPTIQDVMDKASAYIKEGLNQEEAIRRAIALITSFPDHAQKAKSWS
ncbi:hypothetical protein [Spirosoma sp. KNUC1025]|uniref:hypothetical protein n=1 Tax=Spirosoma sp. KNUC1025 TaxID=2894082 RepID=UPI00386829DA|nr:hypothetical protein LN737_13385 [Spirosoma sp. KNUC1025]